MAITISTSAINGIDELYPVAGQDNDSQGFRDNFNTIKTQLNAAATDLASLDTNTAKLNATNDFNGNNITEANFIANTEEVNNIGNVSASQNINWSEGNYQTIQAGADITLTLTGWPATGKLAKLRVVCTGDGTSREITWNAGGGGTIKKDGGFPVSFDVQSATNPKIVDFWSSNAGLTVYAKYVGEFS